MRTLRALLPALVAATLIPASARAQVRASEPASTVQTVDGTRFAVDYYRPRVRGRDSIFEQVIFGEKVWTPGANWATTFELSKRIRLNGIPVEAGKYSVWFVFHGDRWTLLLDSIPRRFHMNPPDSTGGVVRFDLTPETGPFTEVLTWSFPEIRVNGGKLRLNFATRQVTLDFQVEPSYDLTMPRTAARPFVGSWRLDWTPSPRDTTPQHPSRFTLSYRNGSLKGHWDVAPFPEWQEFVLISIQPTWFIIADMRQDEVYDVMKNMVLEFDTTGGKASAFTVRGDGDAVWGSGKRER